MTAEGDTTSSLFEFGLRATTVIGGGLRGFAGYTMMWINDLALAPNQVPTTSFLAPGSATLDHESSLFLHGATVGIIASY